MPSIALRIAEPDDCEFAFDVRRAAFSEYMELLGGWDEAQQWQLHQQRFETQEFRIVSWGDADVGIMSVEVEPGCVKVNQIFLLPEYQGRGIGDECMRRVMEEGRSLGLPVRLQVLKVNPRAMKFYLRLGFARTGETETHILMEHSGSEAGAQEFQTHAPPDVLRDGG